MPRLRLLGRLLRRPDPTTLLAYPPNDYQLDEEALVAATDEWPFAEAAFEILRETAEVAIPLAGAAPRSALGTPIPFDRDRAILGGLVVRIMKLLFGVLETSHSRIELANYFTRGLLETAVNILYLVRENRLDAFQAYVAHSFRSDKRLLEEIADKVKNQQGGIELPIDKRIRESIAETLARSGLTEADIPTNKTDTWPSFEARLQAIGLTGTYGGVFGAPSAFIHGGWHELLFYHLREVPGGFELDVDFGRLRPQPLVAITWVVVMALHEYLDYMFLGYAETAELQRRLLATMGKSQRLIDLWEAFLARTASP